MSFGGGFFALADEGGDRNERATECNERGKEVKDREVKDSPSPERGGQGQEVKDSPSPERKIVNLKLLDLADR